MSTARTVVPSVGEYQVKGVLLRGGAPRMHNFGEAREGSTSSSHGQSESFDMRRAGPAATKGGA